MLDSTKEVVVLERDSNGRVTLAAVRDIRTTSAVVAKRGPTDWEHLYALGPGGTRMKLPSCFRLNNECLQALDETCAE